MSSLENPAAIALETKPKTAFFQVLYCDQTCQKTHWFAHKKLCKHLKDVYEKPQLEAAKAKREEESTCINSEERNGT